MRGTVRGMYGTGRDKRQKPFFQSILFEEAGVLSVLLHCTWPAVTTKTFNGPNRFTTARTASALLRSTLRRQSRALRSTRVERRLIVQGRA
eukprot:1932579-Rhodomonas_salina.2